MSAQLTRCSKINAVPPTLTAQEVRDRQIAQTDRAKIARAQLNAWRPLIQSRVAAMRTTMEIPSYVLDVVDALSRALDRWEEDEHADGC